MRPALAKQARIALAPGEAQEGWRWVAEETAIAFVYDGVTHAVMMATPADLRDFALGFSLADGVIEQAKDIAEIEIVDRGDLGCELRIRLDPHCAMRHDRRRRHMAGPVGCGLCGIESLTEVARAAPRIDATLHLDADTLAGAMEDLAQAQRMNRRARALHAAGFWSLRDGLVAVREDVGRHNALDKLHGALMRDGIPGADGVVLLTSRVSVDMVQKVARLGAPILVAISAPTALAVRTAEACGMTLVALARGHECEVFTHGQRMLRGTVMPSSRLTVDGPQSFA